MYLLASTEESSNLVVGFPSMECKCQELDSLAFLSSPRISTIYSTVQSTVQSLYRVDGYVFEGVKGTWRKLSKDYVIKAAPALQVIFEGVQVKTTFLTSE